MTKIVNTTLIMLCIINLAQAGNYIQKNNIPYYQSDIQKNDSYINERCLLDIYYPANTKNFATIVWFHGGGLSGGEKEIPNELKEKNLCIVAVNYRLHPNVNAPEYIKDAAAAVAWVFKYIASFGGNNNAIFVAGYSAGGYLAKMITLDKSWLNAHQIDANKIAGTISMSGHTITHFTIRKEQGIDGLQATVDAYAPLYHVRNDAPPLLLITGDRELELLGRYEENAYFARMMKLAGHTKTKLYELDGFDHNMTYPAMPLMLKEIEKIKQMLNTNL